MQMFGKLTLGFCAAALVVGTAGCARLQKDAGLRFDGERMRISAKTRDKKDRSLFRVTVSPVSRSLDGARDAALFGGTQYCIENFGTSNIRWAVAPSVEDVTPYLDRDRLTLEGQCRP